MKEVDSVEIITEIKLTPPYKELIKSVEEVIQQTAYWDQQVSAPNVGYNKVEGVRRLKKLVKETSLTGEKLWNKIQQEVRDWEFWYTNKKRDTIVNNIEINEITSPERLFQAIKNNDLTQIQSMKQLYWQALITAVESILREKEYWQQQGKGFGGSKTPDGVLRLQNYVEANNSQYKFSLNQKDFKTAWAELQKVNRGNNIDSDEKDERKQKQLYQAIDTQNLEQLEKLASFSIKLEKEIFFRNLPITVKKEDYSKLVDLLQKIVEEKDFWAQQGTGWFGSKKTPDGVDNLQQLFQVSGVEKMSDFSKWGMMQKAIQKKNEKILPNEKSPQMRLYEAISRNDQDKLERLAKEIDQWQEEKNSVKRIDIKPIKKQSKIPERGNVSDLVKTLRKILNYKDFWSKQSHKLGLTPARIKKLQTKWSNNSSLDEQWREAQKIVGKETKGEGLQYQVYQAIEKNDLNSLSEVSDILIEFAKEKNKKTEISFWSKDNKDDQYGEKTDNFIELSQKERSSGAYSDDESDNDNSTLNNGPKKDPG